MTDRLIPQLKLSEFTARCLERLGLAPDDARLVGDTLVTSNLRGVDSHGVVRLPHYATRLRNGTINPKPSMRVQRTGPATAMVDGGAGMGQLVAVRAMKEAIELAREAGAGAVGAKNSSHCGACAYYAELAARAGMIGIALTHSDPIMVPTGMKRIFLGSNPIASISLSRRLVSGARASTEMETRPGITLAPPGSTSTCPTVATAPSISLAAALTRKIAAAALRRASSRTYIGVVPA